MIMKCAYRNLWSTIKIDNNVSVFNPGGEMGRLVSTHMRHRPPQMLTLSCLWLRRVIMGSASF